MTITTSFDDQHSNSNIALAMVMPQASTQQHSVTLEEQRSADLKWHFAMLQHRALKNKNLRSMIAWAFVDIFLKTQLFRGENKENFQLVSLGTHAHLKTEIPKCRLFQARNLKTVTALASVNILLQTQLFWNKDWWRNATAWDQEAMQI